jgi:cytochrome P450
VTCTCDRSWCGPRPRVLGGWYLAAPVGDPVEDFFIDNPKKLDDPFADVAWLREHHPVHRHGPTGQWFVFPYDEVRSLFADKRLSADRIAGFADAAPEAVRDEVLALVPYLETWLIFRDGSAHSDLRAVLHRGFNAKAIESLREPIERAANTLLDRAVDSGRLDVAADYGFLLPVYVLADFMGVPAEDHNRVVQWSVDFVDFFNVIPITEDTARRMITTTTEMTAYMSELLAARSTVEREDFLGLMAQAARAGEVTEEEVVGSTMLLLIAGHLPVRNLIGNVVWLLQQYPREYDRLLSDPSLLESVIEEALRYEPPVTAIPRIATEDIVVLGQTIPAGDILQLSILAANRDPSRFPDPDRFDAGRHPRGVLSFGHGPHGCIGARLAREQATIALEVLFRRAGGAIRPDESGDIRWYRNVGNRGPEALPVLLPS